MASCGRQEKVAPPPALLEVTAPGWEPSFLRAVIDTTRLLLIKPEISVLARRWR